MKIEFGKWISVRDALPKNNNPVIACNIGGEIDIAWYVKRDGLWYTELYECEIDGSPSTVVAWMPLPDTFKDWDYTDFE